MPGLKAGRCDIFTTDLLEARWVGGLHSNVLVRPELLRDKLRICDRYIWQLTPSKDNPKAIA